MATAEVGAGAGAGAAAESAADAAAWASSCALTCASRALTAEAIFVRVGLLSPNPLMAARESERMPAGSAAPKLRRTCMLTA